MKSAVETDLRGFDVRTAIDLAICQGSTFHPLWELSRGIPKGRLSREQATKNNFQCHYYAHTEETQSHIN